jgi:UDP-4-amino-4-deoxy-L-arabinose formyltransferase/UDP-glucuronic acid dehydrogenase (UDP-4-keto-hexauronic acid decarboxylating)
MPETLQWIRSCGVIDLAVSINYSGVLGNDVIGIFTGGVLNLHGGDLPRFRGNACQAWALINGEERIGLCVHKMVPDELDSGDIVARSYFPININTRIGEVYDWMGIEGSELMEKAVTLLERDREWCLEMQSKDPHLSLRCFPRRPADGKIDWKSSAAEIVRLVNASSEPYAGAFTAMEEKRIIVWRAYVTAMEFPYLAVPGQVIEKVGRHGGVVIAAGEGAVELTEVDEGVGRASPTAALRSVRSRLR